MSRAVADWFRASALRGIPNAGWARAVSESVVSRRPGVGIAIRIGNDLRLAKMHSPAVAGHGAANPPPSVRSDQATRSRLIGDSASIHAGAHEREILNIPKLPEVRSSVKHKRFLRLAQCHSEGTSWKVGPNSFMTIRDVASSDGLIPVDSVGTKVINSPQTVGRFLRSGSRPSKTWPTTSAMLGGTLLPTIWIRSA